jgi:hypothetical protein
LQKLFPKIETQYGDHRLCPCEHPLAQDLSGQIEGKNQMFRKRSLSVAAIAREMAAFLWAIGQHLTPAS